jgi:hypothetical protein
VENNYASLRQVHSLLPRKKLPKISCTAVIRNCKPANETKFGPNFLEIANKIVLSGFRPKMTKIVAVAIIKNFSLFRKKLLSVDEATI